MAKKKFQKPIRFHNGTKSKYKISGSYEVGIEYDFTESEIKEIEERGGIFQKKASK